MAIGKRAFYQQMEMPLAEAYALAARAMVDNLAHPDAGEGIGAFLDKRDAALGGRVNHDSYPDDYIRGILTGVKRIAMVGASANSARPSFFVLKYLSERGFTMLPINPGLAGGAFSACPSMRAWPTRPDRSTWSTSSAIPRRRAPSSTRRWRSIPCPG